MVSDLKFRSIIHLVYFCVWPKKVVQFHSFAHSCPVFLAPFIEETFSPCIFFLPLSQINWPYNCEFISEHSVFLTYVSIFVPYYTVLTSFVVYLEIQDFDLPALFFFFQIALATQGLLCFHINFRIICFSSVNIAVGILIQIALTLDCFGSMDTVFQSMSMDLTERDLVCVVFNFFHLCFIVFRVQVFYLFG